MVSSTTFQVFAVERISGTRPRFDIFIGTGKLPAASEPQPIDPDADKVVDWLEGAEAQQYRGQWVALDRSTGLLLESGASPRDLSESAFTGTAMVVFVPRRGTHVL